MADDDACDLPREASSSQLKGGSAPPFESLAFELSSIGFAVSARFRASLAPFDIEPRQFALLRAVGFAGGQSQRSLAERLTVPTSSMVSAVDDLEQRGLIERRAMVDDRRVRALHLTAKGEDLLKKVLPVAMGVERSIRDTLGPDGSATLGKLLSAIGPTFGIVPGAAHSAFRDPDV